MRLASILLLSLAVCAPLLASACLVPSLVAADPRREVLGLAQGPYEWSVETSAALRAADGSVRWQTSLGGGAGALLELTVGESSRSVGAVRAVVPALGLDASRTTMPASAVALATVAGLVSSPTPVGGAAVPVPALAALECTQRKSAAASLSCELELQGDRLVSLTGAALKAAPAGLPADASAAGAPLRSVVTGRYFPQQDSAEPQGSAAALTFNVQCPDANPSAVADRFVLSLAASSLASSNTDTAGDVLEIAFEFSRVQALPSAAEVVDGVALGALHRGSSLLGRWGFPVTFAAVVYGILFAVVAWIARRSAAPSK